MTSNNKTLFSLASLVVFLALTLVAPFALAGDFKKVVNWSDYDDTLSDDGAAEAADHVVEIPKEKRISKDGYLVIATNIDGSGIAKPPGSDKDEPKAHERTPAQLLYNVL